MVNQLERSVNSRLEATVGRQIQAQFQTTGKHALQVLTNSTGIVCLWANVKLVIIAQMGCLRSHMDPEYF